MLAVLDEGYAGLTSKVNEEVTDWAGIREPLVAALSATG
jgi:hypothetical protein